MTLTLTESMFKANLPSTSFAWLCFLISFMYCIVLSVSNGGATTTTTTTTTSTTPTAGINYDQTNWPAMCKTGTKQSPIDLPIDATKYNTTPYFQIISTNYTILNRLNLEADGKSFFVNATTLGFIVIKKNGILYSYDAVDVHFHFPSEHTIGGHYADIEMHIKHHKNVDTIKTLNNFNSNQTYVDPDAAFTGLVVAVLFKAESGSTPDNKILKSLKLDRNGPILKLDLSSYPPVNKEFYFYEGSLTVPDCPEIVNWVVNKNVELMSKYQMINFVKWITQYYGLIGNARSIQSVNTRTIYYQYYPAPVSTTNTSFLRTKALMYLLFFLVIYY